MAWQWVAPTATAVVALGGIAATWLTARGGRESQERLQVAQHDETRKLTRRNERRQAYADFAGEIREWSIRSGLQGFLTSVNKRETLESREAASKVLSDWGVGMTVDEVLALPEVVAAVAAKRVGSVSQLAAMSPQHALVAFGQIMRLSASIRLIGGREVVAAVDKVQAALIVPLSSMLTAEVVAEKDAATLREALGLAEKAMANELRLSDET
jgi:hypothetical protein